MKSRAFKISSIYAKNKNTIFHCNVATEINDLARFIY